MEATINAMSPQELAEACARAMWNGDNASRHLGMTIEHIAPGEATLSMTLTETMTKRTQPTAPPAPALQVSHGQGGRPLGKPATALDPRKAVRTRYEAFSSCPSLTFSLQTAEVGKIGRNTNFTSSALFESLYSCQVVIKGGMLSQ